MVLTGNFNKFFIFFSIIIFHELGHILGGVYYKWKIDKIVVLPFGGLTIFNEDINKPLKEEFIICILGPLFQTIYYLLVKDIIDIKTIHYNLLIFNLLPIFPLDGSKIFNIIFNKLFSFKFSLYLTNIISFVIIIGLSLSIKFNLLFILSMFFLLIKNIKEIKRIKFIFNKFLLERYFKFYNFKKSKTIFDLKLRKMKREYRHLFFIESKYVTEREILKKTFDLNSFL